MTASTGNDLGNAELGDTDAAGLDLADLESDDLEPVDGEQAGAAQVPAALPARRRLVPAHRARAASSRRRRRSSTLVLTLALMATGLLWSVLAPSSSADTSDNAAVREGRALYLQSCSTCHGLNAAGTISGPSLVGVGSAAVDFQVGTGRMPLAAPAAQAERKDPSFSQTQIDQISAFIETLGGGTTKPTVTAQELAQADLALGGELYRSNCAQCHTATGAGAPLTYGKYAPALSNATPTQILEAMRIGPESMPVFGSGQVSDTDAKAIAAYIVESRAATSPGGDKLGSYGPVPEGLLAILIGVGGLLGVCLWIGARQKV